MDNEMIIFAHNLRLLMAANEHNQTAVAKKSGVAQRTISNLLNPGKHTKSPTIDTVSAIAEAYGLTAWQMLIEHKDIASLTNNGFKKLVQTYATADQQAKDAINQIAEITTRYQPSTAENKAA